MSWLWLALAIIATYLVARGIEVGAARIVSAIQDLHRAAVTMADESAVRLNDQINEAKDYLDRIESRLIEFSTSQPPVEQPDFDPIIEALNRLDGILRDIERSTAALETRFDTGQDELDGWPIAKIEGG